MTSYSEYGQLRKVLLGTVEDYKPSCWAWKAQTNVNAEDFANAVAICDAAIPGQIIDEVAEDLLDYELALETLGVEVIRPPRISNAPVYETDVLYSFGRDFYNIRDLHIVFGEKIIASAPSQPNRILEINELRDFVAKVANELGLAYIACPTPRLITNPVYPNIRNSSGDLEFTEEVLAANLGSITQEIWHRLTENEIPFIAEVNEEKFGSYTPGTKIPIISEKEAKDMNPDYFLVLPWHFKDNILAREEEYISKGGKFIFPLPEIEIV